MKFRDDIAKWRFRQLNEPYELVAKRSRLSPSTVWAICSKKGEPGDPNVSTITALFKGLGLKTEYALNFQLKRSEFHLAVNGAKAG